MPAGFGGQFFLNQVVVGSDKHQCWWPVAGLAIAQGIESWVFCLQKMSLRDKTLPKVCFLVTETKLWGANRSQPLEVPRHFLQRQGALSEVLTAVIALTSVFHGDEMHNTVILSLERGTGFFLCYEMFHFTAGTAVKDIVGKMILICSLCNL